MANAHTLALIEKAKQRHAELLAQRAAKAAQIVPAPSPSQAQAQATLVPNKEIITNVFTQSVSEHTNKLNTSVDLNEKQAEAVERGLRGQSFTLIGAAGTGKTTTTQELIKLIQQAAHMRPLSDSTKHLDRDAPGFVICGYTNKAVNNIRKKLPTNLQKHCMTIHKLIEYAPEYFEITDEDGNQRTSMRFVPSRNGANPLPHISTIIFEESSMIGTDLYSQVVDALPRPAATQFIFLGDIFQLPPVFGPSILGFKMSELPVVELTHVYRQALESPIISLATAIRTNSVNDWLRGTTQLKSDNKLVTQLMVDNLEHGKVTVRPWKKRLANVSALKTVANAMISLIASKEYNPEVDQILCPFNKSFGTVELNKDIAHYLTTQRGEITHEVIGRFTRSYWAVGDKVLVDRHDAIIRKIEPTIGYCGKPTRTASTTLDRSGYDPITDGDKKEQRSVDDILNELDAIAEADDEGKNLASHTITVWIDDLDEERKLSTAGEINAMLLSYALTVHKSQGSEWPRVFVLLHSSHATMCSRELLYTAFTRAKQELYVICEGDVGGYTNQLVTGSGRAVIPGVTLAQKIEYFKGKAQSYKEIN